MVVMMIVDPDSARMPNEWRQIYMYSLARVCLCSSYYMAKLTLLGVDYLTTHHHNYIQRPYVGKMTRHTRTYMYIFRRRKKRRRRRRRNIMSRHIRRRKNVSHLLLILVQIWKKLKSKWKRKGQYRLLLFDLSYTFNRPYDVKELNQQNEYVTLTAM